MNEVTISDETTIDAPIAAVWAAIQTPAEHARWKFHQTQRDILGGLEKATARGWAWSRLEPC